jgi:hypothetical protein
MDLYIYIPIAIFVLLIFLFMTNIINTKMFFSINEGFDSKDTRGNIQKINSEITSNLKVSDKIDEYNEIILNMDDQAGLLLLAILKKNPNILTGNNTELLTRFNSITEFKKNLNVCSKFLDDTSNVKNIV